MNNNNYQEIIEDLVWKIEASEEELSLTFVCCNYPNVIQEIIKQVDHTCEVEVSQLQLQETAINLYDEIEKFSQDKNIKALFVCGFEEVRQIDDVIKSANLHREKFRSSFSFPIILFVNDVILTKFNKLAKDFQTWGGITVRVDVSYEDLVNNLQAKIDDLFNTIMGVGYTDFLSNQSILGNSYKVELESIIKDIEKLGKSLPLELQGGISFIKGRDFYEYKNFNEALDCYQQCLRIWDNVRDIFSFKKAILQFHIGLVYYRLSEQKYQNKIDNLKQARQHLKTCINLFEQENRDDLLAKFINCLGEVLRGLEEWDVLEALANKSVDLNKKNTVFLAEAYEFLAEICLQKKQYTKALSCINSVLYILKETSGIGIYYLLFALIQENLGKHQEAIAYENKGIDSDVKVKDRLYFLELLERLRSLYFEHKQYLDAYTTKLNIQSLKQQYGLIAFVGASRVKASKDRLTNLSQEIASSGRQYDVEKLVNRLSSINNKVIIIYGQSGVGKSSIIEAGLIPALQQKQHIKNHTLITVKLRFYNNWKQELGQLLTNQTDSEYTTESLIEILKEKDKNYFLTVLVFDQFEEFFFVTQTQQEVNEFFQFFAHCLKIVYLKVVFSLREDYIYLLLQGTRHLKLDSINDNILDKNILYYLGNLSPEVTTQLITQLTQRCNFILEDELINQLVKDLTTEFDEIRPIELQIIGSQIQTEEVITLKKYQKYGQSGKERTEKLVNDYLDAVINSCGDEKNRKLAKLVLSLLVDEKNNTRPLKTKLEISEALTKLDIKDKQEKLDSVLAIFVMSGLVMLLPEKPVDRYQLVHDYLIDVIREQQGNALLAKFEQLKREKQQETIAKVRWLKGLQIASVFLLILSGIAIKVGIDADISAKKANNQETIAFSNSSNAYHLLNRQLLDPLIEALKAGKNVQKNEKRINPNNRRLATLMLRQSLYDELREKNRLLGHQSSVHSVVFSPDGETLASASDDNTIKLWSREGKLLQTLEGHQSWVWSVVFSPDGETLASASDDKTIKLWSREGKLLQTLSGHQSWVWSVVFSPDGETLASASHDKTIKLWSQQGKLLQTLEGHQSSVYGVVFSPDGETLASASHDKTIKLWSRQGKLLQTLSGHQSTVYTVVFSPDGDTLASASDDKTIKLWSQQGKLVQTLSGHQSSVRSVVFSPDGNTLASASYDNTIKLWSLDLDDLVTQGCEWVGDYLKYSAEVSEEDRKLCKE